MKGEYIMEMTIEQAKEIITQVCVAFNGNWADHQKIQTALLVLTNPKPAAKPTAAAKAKIKEVK